jgi:TonB family protein
VALLPDEERLIPLTQEPPQVWPGYCMNRKCEKYFYRVGFKVKPDGKVHDVRLVASNNATFSDVVLKAVSQWRYQPVAAEREEEVVLRISSW